MRPPAFNTPEELQEKIHDYFNGGMKKRTVIIGKGETAIPMEIEVPTISGLAYFLGFESRQSFYDYEKKEGFTYTIKRARLIIEQEYEEQLQHGNTVGAIFALKNMGWIDKLHNENVNIEKPIFHQLDLDVQEDNSAG
jgi:hypothetical protein